MPLPQLAADATDAEAQRAGGGQFRRHASPGWPGAGVAAGSIECEVESGGDVLVELLALIEFGHDQDQSVEQIIAGIRRDLDKDALP